MNKISKERKTNMNNSLKLSNTNKTTAIPFAATFISIMFCHEITY